MIYFFGDVKELVFAVEKADQLNINDQKKLEWLFSGQKLIEMKIIEGNFIGPRKEMITPWSTNAVEITQNMGLEGIQRIERFVSAKGNSDYDPMLENSYEGLGQELFFIDNKPEDILHIQDIASFNITQGLALSEEEIVYLDNLSERLERPLTDSEVFGFSQVNSEHCRHKIFNGTFIIDDQEQKSTLFQLIRKTSAKNPNKIVSAYSDNVAFISGPEIEQFAPEHPDKPAFFEVRKIKSIISLKAETHNFPTTVEPFNGAATGSGGEIRDRMAGGTGSMPLAGTAVYMTSYPRLEAARSWEKHTTPRKWLYQSPDDILIKASNGASDFGNKFGQPLISGSVLTFEHFGRKVKYGFDKVIMLAGGIGFAKDADSHKGDPTEGDRIVVMGGDNYRIGMGGGSVSSVATGEYDNAVELNAVQRSNPEMQKRVANVIRALAEMKENPIVSVHDHGAGGHLNALSELIEQTGGIIDISKLPVGDPTLSFKEIVGNESQERMGLLMRSTDLELLDRISKRERAPMYDVGEARKDGNLVFSDLPSGEEPIKLALSDMFGSPPQTVLKDRHEKKEKEPLNYDIHQFESYLEDLLQMEAVACKDWLTNKVDRSVTGRVAMQQTTGAIQLPLNNVGVMALDYKGKSGIATSIGHAPVAALLDPEAGSRLSVAEALTNLIWAPISDRLKGVSLSANWMWPAKNQGENARLFKAVEAISNFAIDLGINIPTGKDSLSMKQQYKDETIMSPGTVIISSVGEVSDINKIVTPELKPNKNTVLLYIEIAESGFELGGSSFAQLLGSLGEYVPDVKDTNKLKTAFTAIQELVVDGRILAGHDVGAGGLITSLLEMCFPNTEGGLHFGLDVFGENDMIKILFSEKPGLVIQVDKDQSIMEYLLKNEVKFYEIGYPVAERILTLDHQGKEFGLKVEKWRDIWMKSSFLMDSLQVGNNLAVSRFKNYKKQAINFKFPEEFTGKFPELSSLSCQPRAAIIREKGVNGDREMAYSLYAAGFEVKDVHMTDLISGRETLEDVQMIVFVGGFSNSDVLGSAKGWAGAFLYNKMARESLAKFFDREDTLSLGVCNGCQLMMELDLLKMGKEKGAKMSHNDSGKFESSFLGVKVRDTNSVLFDGIEGSELGIWVAHGEGKFEFSSSDINDYNIPLLYSQEAYPGNPNGSDFNAAAVCSENGRHMAIMPHLERAIFPWQWAHYPYDRKEDQISPWLHAFINARNWIALF